MGVIIDWLNRLEPEEIWKYLIKTYSPTTVLLVAASLYFFIKGWLDQIRGTRELYKGAVDAVQAGAQAIRRKPGGERTVSALLTIIFVLLELSWLGCVLVMANLMAFVYNIVESAPTLDFKDVPIDEFLTDVNWYSWTTFSTISVSLAALGLIVAVTDTFRSGIVMFFVGFPAGLWLTICGLVVVVQLIGDGLFNGRWFDAGDGLLWHLLTVVACLVYFISFGIAMNVAQRMGAEWKRPVADPSSG